jgi:hypothetical protein
MVRRMLATFWKAALARKVRDPLMCELYWNSVREFERTNQSIIT